MCQRVKQKHSAGAGDWEAKKREGSQKKRTFGSVRRDLAVFPEGTGQRGDLQSKKKGNGMTGSRTKA